MKPTMTFKKHSQGETEKDSKEFIESLNRNSVRYLIVDSFALSYYMDYEPLRNTIRNGAYGSGALPVGIGHST